MAPQICARAFSPSPHTQLPCPHNSLPHTHTQFQMGGYSYLKFVRELSMRVEDDWDAVVADMEEIRAALLSR
eukprot:353756-Chlamydomonas_euryale.AAC.7